MQKPTSVNVKVAKRLQEIAKKLEGNLNAVAGERVGFALLVFPFGGPGRIEYVSNANRKDMNRALAEFVMNSLSNEAANIPSPPSSDKIE